MVRQTGLRVTVEGDLPDEVISQISSAVAEVVRREVAGINILGDYREEEHRGIVNDGTTGGIIFLPPDGS